jgi:hypothetical protein
MVIVRLSIATIQCVYAVESKATRTVNSPHPWLASGALDAPAVAFADEALPQIDRAERIANFYQVRNCFDV